MADKRKRKFAVFIAAIPLVEGEKSALSKSGAFWVGMGGGVEALIVPRKPIAKKRVKKIEANKKK